MNESDRPATDDDQPTESVRSTDPALNQPPVDFSKPVNFSVAPKSFRAVCPITDSCSWHDPLPELQRTEGKRTHEHIVEAHPEVLNDPETARRTQEAYNHVVWAKYEPVP